jgi:hypothetical protein
MLQRCVDDALRGQRYPLSLIAHLPVSRAPLSLDPPDPAADSSAAARTDTAGSAPA